jgi:hypothetical protein
MSPFLARRIIGEENFFGPEDWREILKANLQPSTVDSFPLDENALISPCQFFPNGSNGNGGKNIADAHFHALFLSEIDGKQLTLLNLFSLAKERGFDDYFENRFGYGHYNFLNNSVCEFGWATILKESPEALARQTWDSQKEMIGATGYRVSLVVEEVTALFLRLLKAGNSILPDNQWKRCGDFISNGSTCHIMVGLLNGKISIAIKTSDRNAEWNIGAGAVMLY